MEQAEYALMARVQDRHWWWRGRARILQALLDRRLPAHRPLTVADVGSGFGCNVPLLMRYGPVTCLETEPQAVDALRQRWGDQVEVLAAGVPQPLGRRFDLILLADVLEHIEDDAGAVDWLHEHLADGGHVVLTVPAHLALWTQMDLAVHHRRRYSRRALVALLGRRLEVVHASYYNAILLGAKLGFVAFDRLQRRRHPDRPPRSYNDVPPAPVNWLFRQTLSAEAAWISRWRLPLGVSLVALARKTQAGGGG